MILEWFLRFLPKALKSNQNIERDTSSGSVSKIRNTDVANEFFANASNFTINGANMLDHQQIFQTIYNTITTEAAALDRLLPYTCPEAAVDSSARDPPPRCHLGTRQRILDTLNDWLVNHLWKIFWLDGPAGTGKSAVAQTFAEMCLEQGRLGAAYFFFRSSGRNDPRTVIPTLAYQLAVNVSDYGHLLACTIARDPSIFEKTPRIQLRRLIVEPFTLLQAQVHWVTQTPLLIILDGLDECEGIEAQCEIVEMIGEAVRLRKDLPLIWLIASRPEPHLLYIFSRADFSIDCSKEVLLVDADTKDDVNRYLRDSFNDIRMRFRHMTDAAWPSKVQSRRVEDIASGLFALAATIVRYISDITYGDPVGRLDNFLAFMTSANHITTTNPLHTLDLLYSQILSEIPDDIYPITKRILSFHEVIFSNRLSVQLCCNLLRMDKHEYYNAVHKLYSLLDIPSPDRASAVGLSMHHASFGDYLRSPFRSGRFHINGSDALVDYSKTCFLWYKTILEEPGYISDDSFRTIAHSTALPGLKWVSPEEGHDLMLSHYIKEIICDMVWSAFLALPFNGAEELLGQLEDFDFRYMLVSRDDKGKFARFAEWLFAWGPRNTLLHTEPQDELEKALLHKAVHEVGRRMEPAIFPMVMINDSESYRYIFISRNIRSCLFWFNEECELSGRCRLSRKVLLGETYTVSDCIVHYPE